MYKNKRIRTPYATLCIYIRIYCKCIFAWKLVELDFNDKET